MDAAQVQGVVVYRVILHISQISFLKGVPQPPPLIVCTFFAVLYIININKVLSLQKFGINFKN